MITVGKSIGDAEIALASGANERRTSLIEYRHDKYAQVFQTFVKEERILKGLYAPLGRSPSDSTRAYPLHIPLDR